MIVRNSAKCLRCGDEIESKHRHDWQTCSCDNIFVDGGHDYIRFGFVTDEWVDTSIYSEEEVEDDGNATTHHARLTPIG